MNAWIAGAKVLDQHIVALRSIALGLLQREALDLDPKISLSRAEEIVSGLIAEKERHGISAPRQFCTHGKLGCPLNLVLRHLASPRSS
jgi:hypothetical protein